MDLKEFKSYFSKKITPPMKSYAEYLIDYCGGNYMMLYDPNDRAKAICTRCRRKINLKSEVKHLKIAATDQCMRKIGILGNDGSCDLVHLSKCPNCSNAYLAVHLWRLTNMDKYDFRGLLYVAFARPDCR